VDALRSLMLAEGAHQDVMHQPNIVAGLGKSLAGCLIQIEAPRISHPEKFTQIGCDTATAQHGQKLREQGGITRAPFACRTRRSPEYDAFDVGANWT